jgi:hypothetical protein
MTDTNNSEFEIELKALQDAPVVGNAYSDSALMQRIHAFAVNPKIPINLRGRALNKLNEVMGLDETCDETCYEQCVRNYVNECAEIDELGEADEIDEVEEV